MHPVTPVLQLVNILKRIEGRKKMQKIVHILKVKGAPFQERFEYSYYGMYSPQLRSELDILDGEGLVKESEGASSSNSTYVFESTPALEELLKTFKLDTPPTWTETAKHLNTLSPMVLEGISTILFIKKSEPTTTDYKTRLLQLKPHLKDVVDECLAEVGKL